MKKKTKKTSKAGSSPLDLVAAMTKLVERLEVLEKKTDQLVGRISSLPSEVKNIVANSQRPAQQSHHFSSQPQPGQGVREKILYEVVCADCFKNCKVPFRPSPGRAVYCPECFAIRKAGHTPKDPTANIVVPSHVKELKTAPVNNKSGIVSRSKKSSKAGKKSAKKKK